jgi:hypothetical protein
MKANLYFQIVSVLLFLILPCNIIHSQEFEMPGFIRSIASCDMDQDGSNDIIVSCPYQDTIVILFNDGYGNFNIQYYNRLAGDILCGDFDGDEIPDILSGREGYLYFIKNNGNGSLEGNTIIMDLSGAYTLYDLVDMNNDNWNDIVYDYPDHWGIFKNNGDLTLTNEIIGSGNENKPEPYIGYLNSDSLPDLLVSYSYDYSEVTKYQINNNDFSFSTYLLNDMAFTQIISELNNEFPNDLILFRNPTPQVYLYENTGDANFIFKGIHNTLNTYGVIFTNANDYNQDGYDDFSYVQCNWVDCTDSIYIELNDKNWSYEPAQKYYIGPIMSLKVNSIDLNNDNYPDFYISGYGTDSKIKILWNCGDGTFSYLNPVGVQDLTLNKNFTFKVNPNPFNTKTKINYSLDNESTIQIKVFNNLGQLVETITETGKSKGSHSYDFDASELNTGIYFCTLIVNGKSAASMKMVVL